VQYFLARTAEAQEEGLKPSSADYSWKAFEGTHSSIVEACNNENHGGKSEKSRSWVKRNNFSTQLK
jgi:hypothetical protein